MCVTHAHEDARGDALRAMPEGMLVINVKIVHAPAIAYLQGTVARGKSVEVDAATTMVENNKEDEHRHDIDGGACDRELMVMESTRKLGKGAMRVVNRLELIHHPLLISLQR